MITSEGRTESGRVLANYLGSHVAVGIGSTAPSATDTSLVFEVFRAPVRSRAYDPNTKRVVITATIPDHLELYVAEIGLVNSADSGGGLVTTFDSNSEEWVGGSWTSTGIRVGADGLNLSASSATTAAGSRNALSNYRSSDVIQVAYYGEGGTVQVSFENTAADYHHFSFTANTGYNVYSIPVSSLTKVGSPDLSSSTGVTVTHSGTGSVTMDAIRVNSISEEESLIVRQVMGAARRKVAGMPMDIEIPFVVNA